MVVGVLALLACPLVAATDPIVYTGPDNVTDPIVYTGPDNVDFNVPDGGLRVAVGVQNYQLLRAYRNDPAQNDGFGWTYHHSPMMQFWKGVMYVLCNSTPKDEDTTKGHVLLMTSADLGITWTFPLQLFDTLSVVENGTKQDTLNNHRIGFWTSPSSHRLYAMTAYYPSITGQSPGGNDDDIARKWYGYAIREVRSPTEFGPPYFVVDNPSLYSREKLPLPYYQQSSDEAFLSDCDLLRTDKLVTLSWWEAIRPENFQYPQNLVSRLQVRKLIGVHTPTDFFLSLCALGTARWISLRWRAVETLAKRWRGTTVRTKAWWQCGRSHGVPCRKTRG
jgi:hypothetical protein